MEDKLPLIVALLHPLTWSLELFPETLKKKALKFFEEELVKFETKNVVIDEPKEVPLEKKGIFM